MRDTDRAIFFSIILIGITAMASQIVCMRELLVVFGGSELSLGFIMAGWLLGGAGASALAGPVADRAGHKITLFALLQLSLALVLPFEIVLIRHIKNILNINAGQIIPIFPMAVSSFVVLIPVCAILGFLFTLACRIYGSRPGSGPSAIAGVYVVEGLGAIIGGSAAGLFLIKVISPVSIMALLAVLNIAASLAVSFYCEDKRYRYYSIAISAILLIIALSSSSFNIWNRLDDWALKREWRGHDLVSSKNSVYGNVALTKREGQFSFFDNGLHLYTVPQRQLAEESVHFALLEHPDPGDILLIGGGAGGLLGEIVKHPVRSIDYVELDPLIVETAKAHFPDQYIKPLYDPRVSIKNTDGRFFVKAVPKMYDCAIIDLGDPYTAQLNRYYTSEFFQEIKRKLKTGGIISFGLSSSENYINNELAEFLRSIYMTLKTSFAQVIVIPGERAYFLATDEPGRLTYDYGLLEDRAKYRKLDLRYVREYYLASRLSKEKIDYIERILKKDTGSRINRDFRPVAYLYEMIFWTTQFRDSFVTKLLKSSRPACAWKAVGLLCVMIALFGVIVIRRKRAIGKMALLALAVSGFTTMALQLIILLAFQIIYGYLFYKLSIILTMFMVGMAAGGWLALKFMSKFKTGRLPFIAAQCAFFVYPLALPGLFASLAGSGSGAVSWAGSNVVFAVLPAIGGLIGGFQFPLAARILLKEKDHTGRIAGSTYGIDLAGSCLGAVITGAILIPVIGIAGSCAAIACVNFVITATLIFVIYCENYG